MQMLDWASVRAHHPRLPLELNHPLVLRDSRDAHAIANLRMKLVGRLLSTAMRYIQGMPGCFAGLGDPMVGDEILAYIRNIYTAWGSASTRTSACW